MSGEADTERAKRAAERRANTAQIGEVVVLGQEPTTQAGTTHEARLAQLRVLSERLWRFSGREIEHPSRDQYPGEVFEIRRG